MSATDVRTHAGRIVWGPDDLDRVQREIGRPLLADYRAFILVANGGVLEYAVRLPPDDGRARCPQLDR